MLGLVVPAEGVVPLVAVDKGTVVITVMAIKAERESSLSLLLSDVAMVTSFLWLNLSFDQDS